MSALRAEGCEPGRLLECAGPARSGYCYALSEIFSRTADGCGRRQVAMCLRAGPGARIADKTVLKMMREMGVRCGIRRETDCHRYGSCRGAAGETSGSVIGRDFAADGPWQKMGTDATGFKQPWGRACFAPVHDFGSEEMVAWSASASPDMARQAELLDRLLAKMPEGATPALHGDMGRQHRHAAWCGRLGGRRDRPEHVQKGQLHRQRRHRAGLRPHEGRVLPGKGMARLRVLQGGPGRVRRPLEHEAKAG